MLNPLATGEGSVLLASVIADNDPAQQGSYIAQHSAFTLPDADQLPLNTGDKWSNTKTFNFRMLGSKSFEKIYTVTENIPDLAQKIMMNIWICDDIGWAGELDTDALPTFAEYDQIKYYKMK